MTEPYSLIGNEFLVNSQGVDAQDYSSVASLANGGFIIVWETYDTTQDGSGLAIKAQLYGADRAPIGGEFLVNSEFAGDQYTYRNNVTGLAGGGFVITWQSYDGVDDPTFGGIKARVFDAAGAPLGAEFLVNTQTGFDESQPAIASLADGGFVVTWWFGTGINQSEVHAQRFSASGVRVGGEISVSTVSTDFPRQPDIEGLDDGGFVVVWNDGTNGASLTDIKAQRYSASGTPVGGEILVNSDTAEIQAVPSVTSLAGGGFVIVWAPAIPSWGSITT